MNNFIIRKSISMLLILTLFLTGFFHAPDEVQAKETESLVTKYHLDIGVQQIWGVKDDHNNITWDDGIGQGNKMNVSTTISFPQEVVKADAYVYEASKFKWGNPNYSSNVGTKKYYDSNYLDFACRNINVTSVQVSGNNVSFSSTVTLNSPSQYDLAYELKNLKINEVFSLMAGPNSSDPESDVRKNFPRLYSKLKAGENGVGDEVVAYMYFTPVIIEYQVKEKVTICEACGQCILNGGNRCNETTCPDWNTPDCGCYDPIEITARLELPKEAKQGESYTVADNSLIPDKATVKEAILRKKTETGSWEEVIRWPGQGAGENTGGTIEEKSDEKGKIIYELTETTTGGETDTDTKEITIIEGREVEAMVELQLQEYTYEGHPAKAQDYSSFTVNGENYSSRRAYEEGVASNKFIPKAGSNATVEKEDFTKAKVTFPKRGDYDVTLEVKTVDKKILTDTKPIEVRKTPAVEANLGGFQKQNRKQMLSFNVATYPDQPIVDYYVELKDLVTGETVKLTKDQPQKNTSTIKTRSLTLQNSDSYFSNFSLEFLTKTPSYDPAGDNTGQQFQYTVYVKDKKGDTDTVTETFTVVPDLPPEPEILM